MKLDKKTKKEILMITLGLLLFSIVGALATSVIYFKTKNVHDENIINESFANIDINSNNYKIEVLATSESKARVVLSGKVLEKKNPNLQITSNVNNNTLFVKITEKNPFSLINIDFLHVDIKIYLPVKSYESIIATGNNGSIIISDLNSKAFKLKSNNGRIILKNINATDLTATTDNGRITFDNITSSTSTFYADNGSITGNYLSGKLNTNSNNGRINVRLAKITDHINMSSKNGSIRLQFDNKPKKTNFITNANNGSIKVPSSFQSTTGSKYTVTLNSNNGRIIVE